MMPPRRATPPLRFDPWEIGIIVAVAAIVTMIVFALVYRILAILLGETVTGLLLALAVLAGIAATGIAAAIRTLDERERVELQKKADEEGRTL
jgi:membrane protein implicated in regulation of membrane protease activity